MLSRSIGTDMLVVPTRVVHVVKMPTSVFLVTQTSFLLREFWPRGSKKLTCETF